MNKKTGTETDSRVSVVLTLKDPAAAPALVTKLQGALSESMDSVVLSVRGSTDSAVASLLSKFGEQAEAVSVQITLKGNSPVR